MTRHAGVFGSLDTVLLRVRDIDIAVQWYREMLGFPEPYFDPEEWLAVFDLGGSTSLTLWQLKDAETASPSRCAGTFPIFSVSSARETWSLLAGRGVAVDDVLEGGGVVYFTFTDCDGNRLEACQVH